MTKLDGDARGGAALSIRQITGKPIKLICVGEKVEDIEEYYPDRMASRILGMGDVLSLIEKAKENFDEAAARNTMDRIMKNTFDLNDMLDQFEQIKKMGSMKDVLGMIPGVGGKIKDQDVDDRIIDVNMQSSVP
jgi:signal recognition particle subunit SRP54